MPFSELEKNSKKCRHLPRYEELATAIAQYISDERLLPGSPLPGVRELTGLFKTSRNSATEALHYLQDEGIVDIRPSVGVFVAENKCLKQFQKLPDWRKYLETGQQFAFTETLDKFLETGCTPQDQKKVNLSRITFEEKFSASGHIADALLEAEKRIRDSNELDEYHFRGSLSVRKAIAGYLEEKGIKAHPDQIVVTIGYTFAINLVLRILMGYGSKLFIPGPSYLKHYLSYYAHGAHVVSLKTDSDGVNLHELEHRLNNVKTGFFCLTPTHDYPVGTVTSAEKREAILNITRNMRTPVIELDLFSDLFPEAPPAMKSMKDSEHVIYAGSFIHTLALGIRATWLVLPLYLVKEFSYNLNYVGGCSDMYTHILLEIMLNKGHYKRRIENLLPMLRKRVAFTGDLLDKYLKNEWEWEKSNCGICFALTAKKEIDTNRLQEHPDCPLVSTAESFGAPWKKQIYITPMSVTESDLAQSIRAIAAITKTL